MIVPDNNMRESILEKVDTLEDLPTLPDVAMRVISMAHDPKVNLNDLKKVVITDPPLSAKIVRAANSAIYARRVEAQNLDQAIFTLGLDTVVTICSGMSMISALDGWTSVHLNREALWKHSLATAFLSKGLEFRKTRGTVGAKLDLYLSGLLHNIGWIVIDHVFHEEMVLVIEQIESSSLPTTIIEQQIFGTSHAEIGARFLRRWGISEDVALTIEHHHSPGSAVGVEFEAAVIQTAAAIAPFKFVFEPALEEVSDHLPHMLNSTKGHDAMREMEVRYSDHIRQSEMLTNHMMSWL